MVVVVVVEVVGVVSRDRYKFRYISIVKIFNLIQTLKLTFCGICFVTIHNIVAKIWIFFSDCILFRCENQVTEVYCVLFAPHGDPLQVLDLHRSSFLLWTVVSRAPNEDS